MENKEVDILKSVEEIEEKREMLSDILDEIRYSDIINRHKSSKKPKEKRVSLLFLKNL